MSSILKLRSLYNPESDWWFVVPNAALYSFPHTSEMCNTRACASEGNGDRPKEKQEGPDNMGKEQACKQTKPIQSGFGNCEVRANDARAGSDYLVPR